MGRTWKDSKSREPKWERTAKRDWAQVEADYAPKPKKKKKEKKR